MKQFVKLISTAAILFASAQAFALTYNMPSASNSIIGGIKFTSAKNGDNVVSMAQRYDVGFNGLENANPQLDMARGFAAGSPVIIPNEHLLPNGEREGIVVNLPEMRMYYYHDGKVGTYPIGIGKIGKTIPITRAKITYKKTNPTWTPPDDIREFNLEQGVVLPKVMPPGPDNPLGPYAIYTSIPTYLIHSTIFPESVGKRASFGCIRMYESDIQDFFPSVEKGIPFVIENMPVKTGWQGSRLYVEAHEPLEEHNHAPNASLAGMVNMVNSQTNTSTLVDWQALAFLAEERDGIPHEIGFRLQ